MMDRVAQLIRTAGQLRRSIWASLPFRERFAQFLTRLAAETADEFGTWLFGEFLRNGIEDMPPINGQPAQEWFAKHNRNVNRLPRSYGANFGSKCLLVLMRKYHNVTIAREIMDRFMMKFVRKPDEYLEGKRTFSAVQGYVIRGLYNEGVNYMRERKREVSESTLTRTDDEGREQGFFQRIPQPSELGVEEHYEKYIVDLLDSPSVRNALRRIHPSAAQYIRLKYDGYSDTEVIGDPENGQPSMLDHPYNNYGDPINMSSWNTNFKQKIRKLISEVLDFTPRRRAV